MIRQFVLAACFKYCTIGLGLIFSLMVAPIVGPECWGKYVFSLSVVTVAQVVASLGLGMYATRRIATYNYLHAFGRVQVFKRRVLELVFGNSLFFALVLILIAFCCESLSVYICFAFPFLSMQAIISVYYKASKSPAMGVFLGEFITRMIMCIVAAIGLYYFKIEKLGADMIFSFSQAISGLVAIGCCWRIGKFASNLRLSSVRWLSSFRQYASASRVIYWTSLVYVLNSHLGVFLVKIFSGSVEVGQYGIAIRLALFMSMPLMLVNSIIGPIIVEKLNGPSRDLEVILRRFVLGVLTLSLPIFTLLVCAPEWVLSFWGDGFLPAKTAMVLLVLGQFFNLATGSVGMILNMSGDEAIDLRALLWSMLVNVVLSALLIPVCGVLGAAISTALSVAFQGAHNSFYVYFKHRIILFPLLYFIKSDSR